MLSRIWIQRKASSDRFPRVLLFPEGTTTNGRILMSFQLGAFIPGYPIQPVIVRYPHVHFDQSWYDTFLVCNFILVLSLMVPYKPCVIWYAILHRGNISLAKLMFRMFTQFHNFMEVCCPCWVWTLGYYIVWFCKLLYWFELIWDIWFGLNR